MKIFQCNVDLFKIYQGLYKIQKNKMSQPHSATNLRKQFRVGSSNFSLQSCRWKPVHIRQKMSESDFHPYKHHQMRIPNIRLNQTSVLLSDHIYMFGGCTQGVHGETFCALNLKNYRWHEIKLDSNPCARDSHGMTVLQHEIYVFGGSNKERYFNDLYTFNNFVNQWKLIENKGTVIPSPRDPMIFLSVKNEYLLLVSGINLQSQQKYLQDSYIWKSGQWKQLTPTSSPPPLILSKAVQINGRIFMFGGLNKLTNQYNSTLYQLIIDQLQSSITFKQVPLTIQIFPEARVNHQLIPIKNQYFLLIGGQKIGKKMFRDLWVFDLLMMRWTRIEPLNGTLKEMHSFSAVLHNNNVYLIGGMVDNRKEINDQVFMIQFANQEIYKSQICQNCVSLSQKKEIQNKKFPKDVMVSVGFLYNMALQIKFPFHALSMLYEAAKHFSATYFRISSQKNISQFNYLKIQFDGCSFGRQQFMSFISHNFVTSHMKKLTQNIKLGALRLGKTFLLVTSDKKLKYIYLLSAQSRVSPHFDEAYVYYSYIENMQLQRIQTQQGIKQRQLILNILRTHLSHPEIILSSQQKTILLIFQPKVVMTAQREYICELSRKQTDIKIWKSQKKVQFLQQRGYKIQQQLQISLRKWMMFYHLDSFIKTAPSFYLNDNQQSVPFLNYNKNILLKLQQSSIIFKVDLPTFSDTDISIKGQIYITSHPAFIQHNYGLLIYSKGLLYSRYQIDFGRLFPQHFYKSKYKRAKTIFYEMGFINIEKGLQENFFKNGFTRMDKYSLLLERIKEKCDEKREEIAEKHQITVERLDNNDGEENTGSKKVKI